MEKYLQDNDVLDFECEKLETKYNTYSSFKIGILKELEGADKDKDMEGRRKALGLRRQTSGKDVHVKEETPKKFKKAANLASKRSQEKEGLLTKDKESPNTSSNCIRSDQRTPKRRVPVLQYPASPGMESVFPRMLGSPEIEVSWDWGCSQVPKDMLPSRLVKRKSPKLPPVVLSPLIQEPRVFQSRQMLSEEENQERLAFYKNVLSQASKCKIEADSKNDCELETGKGFENKAQPNLSTPKRCTKPIAKERDKLNELFDDSADDFMLECTQMVEEQLMNGNINVGPVVSIDIPNRKHDLSPDYEAGKVHKRVCHMKSKLSLFSEAPMSQDTETKTESIQENKIILRPPKEKQLNHQSSFVLKSSVIHSNGEMNLKNDPKKCCIPQKMEKNLSNATSNLRHVTSRQNVLFNTEDSARVGITQVPIQPAGNLEKRLPCKTLTTQPLKQQVTLNNNTVKPNNITQNNITQENMNNNRYDSVDKFRRNSKGVCHSNQNQNVNRGNHTSKNGFTQSTAKENNRLYENKTLNGLTNKAQEINQKADDVTSLLDDGFDLELSSLDFDSICMNTEVPVVPKICTKAEIEAKRLAALSRLKMKMKR